MLENDDKQTPEEIKSDTIHRVIYKHKEILIVATAHVSKESQEEVKRIIEEERPDSVCIELDENRYKSIVEKDKTSNMDIVQVIKQGKAMLIMANLFLASFQRKIAAKLGVQPGLEMIQGIDSAKEIDADIVLADRDIQITFKRIWRKSNFGEKFKLLYQILGSLLVSEKDLEEEDIEKMKTGDMLDNALSVMGETFPLIKEVLIDERDVFLANKIKNAPGDKVVAVLGAGHVPGVIRMITKEKYIIPKHIPEKKFNGRVTRRMTSEDQEYIRNFYQIEENKQEENDQQKEKDQHKEKDQVKKKDTQQKDYILKDQLNNEDEQKLHQILYNQLPPKGKVGRIIGWSVPILILAWIVSGFFTGGWDKFVGNILGYVIGTGVGAAIGCILALSHPITVLVGLVGAWLTVLHPVLGIGMFTGLTEAHFRKPKVRDLENLGTDSQSFVGFYKNRFTHILVVILLSSIGTMLGIFVGIPLFTNTVIPYLTKLMGF